MTQERIEAAERSAFSVEDTLKLALEALKDNLHLIANHERYAYVIEYNNIIVQCEEALAQPEQWGASAITRPEYVSEQKRKTEELRSMLAQPAVPQGHKQEPVAWMEGESVYWHTNPSLNDWIRANGTPLYTTPPQPKVRTGDCLLTGVCASEGHKIQKAQPERVASQEPVGRLESDPYEGHVFIPRIDGDWSMLGKDLYTTPPQRKPLTDDEIREIWVEHGCEGEDAEGFARAIEAAHGIKE